MSKRLQVVLDTTEHRRLQRVARARGLTLSAWVREVLRDAARLPRAGDVRRKVAVLRSALTYKFPTADIGQMLREIEAGYGSSRR